MKMMMPSRWPQHTAGSNIMVSIAKNYQLFDLSHSPTICHKSEPRSRTEQMDQKWKILLSSEEFDQNNGFHENDDGLF